MTRFFVITSGKGGVGKTTTSINLGAAIKYFDEDVLIIDGNLTTPNIGLHLGSPEVPINLNHVINGKADPHEAVYEHESGIKIIPSSLSIKELKNIDNNSRNLKSFKKDFAQLADNIIIDSAAGLGKETSSAIALADEIIIVTNPEMPAITDALKTVKLAEQMKKPVMGVIVTKVKNNSIEMSPETVKEMLEIPILGMVPEDISVSDSLNKKQSVVDAHPKSKAARAYKEIAAKIIGKEYDSRKDKPSIWEVIFKKKLK